MAPLLDLHGKTVEEIPDAVDRFLVRCQNQNAPRARIMTGKGTGKVLAAVKQYLKLGGFHFSFEKAKSGKINEGILIVYLE